MPAGLIEEDDRLRARSNFGCDLFSHSTRAGRSRVRVLSSSELKVDELCITIIKGHKKQKENGVAAGT